MKEPLIPKVCVEGILPVNKPRGCTAFSLIRRLRKHTGIRKIGHAGTLDPFAEGVMVMLVGKDYTRLSDQFLHQDKEYVARMQLGTDTDTFDCDGKIVATSDRVPTLDEIEEVVSQFQGEIKQIPPMWSAKKIKGQKLCDLARKGIVVDREPISIDVSLKILHFAYPYLDFRVCCSKGTYVRTLAHDIGKKLGTYAHLISLTRIRSGAITLEDCYDGSWLQQESVDLGGMSEKILIL